jgi:hypothetical protein
MVRCSSRASKSYWLLGLLPTRTLNHRRMETETDVTTRTLKRDRDCIDGHVRPLLSLRISASHVSHG